MIFSRFLPSLVLSSIYDSAPRGHVLFPLAPSSFPPLLFPRLAHFRMHCSGRQRFLLFFLILSNPRAIFLFFSSVLFYQIIARPLVQDPVQQQVIPEMTNNFFPPEENLPTEKVSYQLGNPVWKMTFSDFSSANLLYHARKHPLKF